MKKIFFLFIFLLFASNSWAKDWDSRLIQAPQLAYSGQTTQAENLIKQYIDEHPEDPNGLFVQAIVLDWKANLNAAQGDQFNKQLLEIYKKANDLAFQRWHFDPDNIDRMIDLGNSYLFLGRKYSDLGNWLKAVLTGKKCQKYLEKAYKIDPSRKDALLTLGGFHYLAGTVTGPVASLKGVLGIHGSKEQGLREVKEATQGLHPFIWDAEFALMFLYRDFEKNQDEALKALVPLEKQFPNNAEIKYKKAQIIEAQDKAKGANSFFELAKWCEANKTVCHQNYIFLSYLNAAKLKRDTNQTPQAKELFAKAKAQDTKLNSDLTKEVDENLANLK